LERARVLEGVVVRDLVAAERDRPLPREAAQRRDRVRPHLPRRLARPEARDLPPRQRAPLAPLRLALPVVGLVLGDRPHEGEGDRDAERIEGGVPDVEVRARLRRRQDELAADDGVARRDGEEEDEDAGGEGEGRIDRRPAALEEEEGGDDGDEGEEVPAEEAREAEREAGAEPGTPALPLPGERPGRQERRARGDGEGRLVDLAEEVEERRVERGERPREVSGPPPPEPP